MTITSASELPVLTPLAQRLYDQMQPLHYAEANTGYALARYLASTATLLDPVDQVVNDDEQGRVGWEICADPEDCPDWMLPWLAMWAGVLYTGGRSEEDLRALIADSPAHLRGTRAAIETEVKKYLTGSKQVFFEERADGDAYALKVFTWQSETPETDWAEPRQNLVRNPSAELSADTSVASYGAVRTRSTLLAAVGRASFKLVRFNDPDNPSDRMALYHEANLPSDPVGDPFTFAASFRAETISRTCEVKIIWQGVGDVDISETVSAGSGDIPTGWTRVFTTGEAPAGATGVEFHAEVLGPIPNGEIHYVDARIFTPGEDPTYGDGDTPGWDWAGPPHDSASIQQQTDFVRNAILRYKPAGIVLEYEAVPDRMSYFNVSATHDDYADVNSSYASYAEMRDAEPA